MAKEVTSHMANLTIEVGEYFGVSMEEMRSCFKNPALLTHRWNRVDWEDYLEMTRLIFEVAGHGEDLVGAGQNFLRDRFKFRNTHLYAQFSTWEQMLWVSKHFVTQRLMQGYDMDYEKIGPDFFHVTQSLDPRKEGASDLLYFLTGVWTGSSRLADLHHEIHHLEVSPHQAIADIKFDKRSMASLAIHNSFFSRWKTLRHLKADQQEQERLVSELEIETRNLETAFDAVSDAVLSGVGNEIHQINRAATSLIKHPEFSIKTCKDQSRITLGDNNYLVRKRIQLGDDTLGPWMLTLEDQTRIGNLEQELQETPANIRKNVHKDLESHLGRQLGELERCLQQTVAQFPDLPACSTLNSLIALCRLSHVQGQALVDNQLPPFTSMEAWENALHKLAEEYRAVFHFNVRIDVEMHPPLSSAADRGEIFLLLRETVRNAYRHSGGTEAVIRICGESIHIHDNGAGLRENLRQNTGLGCGSIRTRAQRAGATARMADSPLNGWRIEFQNQESK
jgi:hypothetical protein